MSCDHLKDFKILKTPQKYECDECAKSGDRWVHLRTCQVCGTTLCCDSSPNQHMTKHFHSKGHSLVISAEPNEKWAWCYLDEEIVTFSN